MSETAVPKLDRYFALSQRGTTAGKEVLAGATTFLTMAYIVLVNPAILGQAGMPVAAVAVREGIAIGCAVGVRRADQDILRRDSGDLRSHAIAKVGVLTRPTPITPRAPRPRMTVAVRVSDRL